MSDDSSVAFALRHRTAREAVAASQRVRVMDALMSACAEKGFATSTIQDAVERAGVSRRTFYEHFSDKEDCLVEACQFALEFVGRRVEEDLLRAAAGSWRERLRAVLYTYLSTLAAEPAFAKVLHFEVFAAGDRARAWWTKAMETHSMLLQFLNAAARAEDPSVGEMTREAIVIVGGGIHESVRDHIRRDALRKLPDAVPEICRIVEGLIAPRA